MATPGTGGTITQAVRDGVIYNVHTFISGGTFTAPSAGVTVVEVLVVAGGGGGGGYYGGGGGGGGGGIYQADYAVSGSGTSTVTVGSGGVGGSGASGGCGSNGGNSVFGSLTAIGGGGGGNNGAVGQAGGSGGGGGYSAAATNAAGTLLQGQTGGQRYANQTCGGGGGYSAPGGNGTATRALPGHVGRHAGLRRPQVRKIGVNRGPADWVLPFRHPLIAPAHRSYAERCRPIELPRR